MLLTGFVKSQNGKYKEYLPYSNQVKNLHEKRKVFFTLYNYYMPKEMQIEKVYWHKSDNNTTIYHVFKRFIDEKLHTIAHRVVQPPFQIDVASTQIIHAYIQKTPIVPTKPPKLPVAKLISMLYKEEKCELLFDLNDMFLTLVYERIKKVNPHAKVDLLENEIIIRHPQKYTSATLVIPYYHMIDTNGLHSNPKIKEHMQHAIEHLQRGKIVQIFFVYPKHNNFTKYIEVSFGKSIDLHKSLYSARVVPYSFSFCMRNSERQPRKNKKACKTAL